MEFAIFLAALGAAVAVWVGGMNARESAERAARRACLRRQVQFLDETVAMTKLGLARDDSGRLRFSRAYRFEFSLGDDRRSGSVRTVGATVMAVSLDLPDYRLFDTEDTGGGMPS